MPSIFSHFNSSFVFPFLDWPIPFPPQRLQSHPARGLKLGRLSQTQASFPSSQPWLLGRGPLFSPYRRSVTGLQLVPVLLDGSVRRHSLKNNALSCLWVCMASGSTRKNFFLYSGGSLRPLKPVVCIYFLIAPLSTPPYLSYIFFLAFKETRLTYFW